MFKILFDRDTWQEIFGSIQKNRLRTIVTIVGVLWGIFIYITLSGAAKGLDNGFDRQFENVAINSMFLWAQNTSKPYGGFKTGRSLQLKIEDAQYLYNRVPELQYIAPRNARGIFGSAAPSVVRKNKGETILSMVIIQFSPRLPQNLFMTEAALSIKPILIKNVRFV